MLDHVGAVVDPVEAFSRGGEHGEANFVTSYNKCNARNNAATVDGVTKRSPPWPRSRQQVELRRPSPHEPSGGNNMHYACSSPPGYVVEFE
jgi:hypothetical protein